jgi:cytochrome P450
MTLGRQRVVRPPGPPFSTFGSVRAMRRLRPNGFFDEIHRDHPRLAYVRLGGEHAYLLFDPDLVRTLLVDAGRATAKGRGLERSKELLGEGLLTSEGDHHRRQRRLVQPAFHASRIAGYADVMCEEARLVSAGWRHGACVDMATAMSRLTLRIVGRALFGTDLRDTDIALVSTALSTFLGRFQLLMLPGGALIGRLPTPANQRLRAARDQLDALVYRMIAEHRTAGDTGDLLSMLLLAGSEEADGSGRMSDKQIRDESLTLLLAGHETTANALTWSWLLLAGDRANSTRLHREVDGLGRPPTLADLDALPFTRAVIAESMRLYPPAWAVGRRALEPLTIDGYTVPAGSLLATSQWVVHRDPRWWDGATEFRPGRWINADGYFDDAAPGAPRGAYFPFGAGRRVCVGESFAWTEAVLVLATLAQSWGATVQPDPALGPFEADPLPTMETRAGVTLRPAGRAPLRLRYRN